LADQSSVNTMTEKKTNQTTGNSIPILRKGDGSVHLPVHPKDGERSGSLTASPKYPAVFLDRDGVINEEVGFVSDPNSLRVLPGVAEALRSLASHFQLVVITNQSGIARGLYTDDDLLAVNQELASRLAADGAALDAIYYCPHLPEGKIPRYSIECECRKPKPGMLLMAANDLGISLEGSYMVGDTPRDVQAADSAGVTGIIIGATTDDCPKGVLTAASLPDAAELILSETASSREAHADKAGMSAEPISAVAHRGELA
jgi:D-glycero-D-manno-heptose 1,7-bisphosphate phosphatase